MISVLIPCRNERDTIEACLRSILSQQPPTGGFEVIVADGLSDDGTRLILRRLAQEGLPLRVVENPGQIVSTGLNSALAVAHGEVIVRMDAHTTYAPDYLCQSLAVLKETGADMVGGPWIARGEGGMGRAIAAAFQSPFATGGARSHDPTYEGPVESVYLGCWRREVFERLGGFDETLVRNQDDEFCLRLTLAGGTIWQSPRIRSVYTPRDSLANLFRQQRQYGYWKVRVMQKHGRPASLRHLVPGLFVGALGLLALAAPWWQAARWGFLGLLGIYATANLAWSHIAAIEHGGRFRLALPLVFACYHVGYGVGFWQGIWRFVIRRREPTPAQTPLTRGAQP